MKHCPSCGVKLGFDTAEALAFQEWVKYSKYRIGEAHRRGFFVFEEDIDAALIQVDTRLEALEFIWEREGRPEVRI